MKKIWGGLVLLILGLGILAGAIAAVVEDMILLASCLLMVGVMLVMGGYKTMQSAVAELKARLEEDRAKGEKTAKREITKHIAWTVTVVVALILCACMISAAVSGADLNDYARRMLSRSEEENSLEYLDDLEHRVAQAGPLERLFFAYEDEIQQRKEGYAQQIQDRAQEIMAGIDGLEDCTQINSRDHYAQLCAAADALELDTDDAFEARVLEQVSNYQELEQYRSQVASVRDQYKHTCQDCGGSGGFTCSSCGGRGSTSCSSCGGRGKKLVTWYSEGDWGETSYSSYECTSCNGRGRRSCGCNDGRRDCGCDSGYIYIYEDELPEDEQ